MWMIVDLLANFFQLVRIPGRQCYKDGDADEIERPVDVGQRFPC